MHEWALAQAVVFKLKEYEKNGRKVKSADVVIGDLQDMDKEMFISYVREIMKESRMLCSLRFVDEDAKFRCISCNHVWSLGDVKGKLGEDERESIHFVPELAHAYIKCPACHSPDFEIISGRGVYIRNVVLHEDD